MQIVYEWEDEIASRLDLSINSGEYCRLFYEKLIYNRYTTKLINKKILVIVLQSLNRMFGKSIQKSICFEIYPKSSYLNNSASSINCIPVIIDFWKYEDLNCFYNTYKNCAVIYISSIEVYDWVKKIPLNFKHLPISLPTKYKDFVNANVNRPIDIVLVGRQNDVLMSYLKVFCDKFKHVTFVTQTAVGGRIFYQSNNNELIGPIESREDYFNLIKSGKISFYSTPGMDEGAQRTGGFNPVTPRYLELLAAKCLLLGRYPDTEETRFFEISKVCPNVNSYEHFEQILTKYLNMKKFDFSNYELILKKHYTSCRLQYLKNI